jgi:hypothetical protein
LAVLLLAGIAPAFGCGADEQIRTYTVEKSTRSATPAAPASPARPASESGEAPDRMLAAILPAGDRALFFKVVGPVALIEQRRDEIADFFAKLKASEPGQQNWTTPSGWKEEPGTGMRTATLFIPTDDKPLEMSVTALPWGGSQAELLSNVNRWRGQMELEPIGPQQLDDVISEVKSGEATVTVVELSGRFAGGGMMAPFAGGGFGANRTPPGTNSGLPEGHPPVDSSAAGRRSTPGGSDAVPGVPKFEAPNSWRQLPASGMRKAVFSIGSEAEGGVVTIIDFPTDAGQMIADPLANVNRWRREVGLAEIDKDQLEGSMESIDVDGTAASYVRLTPDAAKPEESQAERATLAAMVTRDDKIWFIKLIGQRNVVLAEEENFKSFLKSIRFADSGGT